MRSEDLEEGVEQHRLPHGLGQARLDAERGTAPGVSRLRDRGQHQDQRRPQAGIRLDALRQDEPVHLGHLDVEKGGRERTPFVPSNQHRLDRGRSAVHGGGAHAPAGEEIDEDPSIRRVVVHAEYRHPHEIGRRARRHVDRPAPPRIERPQDVERAPPVRACSRR